MLLCRCFFYKLYKMTVKTQCTANMVFKAIQEFPGVLALFSET